MSVFILILCSGIFFSFANGSFKKNVNNRIFARNLRLREKREEDWGGGRGSVITSVPHSYECPIISFSFNPCSVWFFDYASLSISFPLMNI